MADKITKTPSTQQIDVDNYTLDGTAKVLVNGKSAVLVITSNNGTISLNNTWTTVGNVPVGYRPPRSIITSAVIYADSVPVPSVMCQITSSGDIQLTTRETGILNYLRVALPYIIA